MFLFSEFLGEQKPTKIKEFEKNDFQKKGLNINQTILQRSLKIVVTNYYNQYAVNTTK